jgi:hypothetical protein
MYHSCTHAYSREKEVVDLSVYLILPVSLKFEYLEWEYYLLVDFRTNALTTAVHA